VRHPFYAAAILMIWACPVITLDRLLFDVLWTCWIVAGARLEERDLVAEYGDTYRAYRGEVPMLVPWRRRG
jgi:protein-S-isoprenylcysteine O-methyltransferase Ste14